MILIPTQYDKSHIFSNLTYITRQLTNQNIFLKNYFFIIIYCFMAIE